MVLAVWDKQTDEILCPRILLTFSQEKTDEIGDRRFAPENSPG